MNIVSTNAVWHVEKAIYGLREARRLWQGERDQQLRDSSSPTKTSLLTLFKVTFIPVSGSLLKAHLLKHRGFHYLTANRSCEIEVSSDSAASLHMIRNGSGMTWRTRHISVKALQMHQIARRGIKFTYMPTTEMAAGSLTKGLGASR